MKKTFLPLALAAMLGTSTPVLAGPSLGLGVSFVFGGGVALGVRVFSTDRPQSGALALGLDFGLGSGSVRPAHHRGRLSGYRRLCGFQRRRRCW